MSERRIGITMHGGKGNCAIVAPLCVTRPVTPRNDRDEAHS